MVKKQGNQPESAQRLIDQITSDPIVNAGYGPQPTALERANAQQQIVTYVVKSHLPAEELAEVFTAVALADETITARLYDTKEDNILEALARSDRKLTKSMTEALLKSTAKTATALVASARDLNRTILVDVFLDMKERAISHPGNKTSECLEFVCTTLRSNRQLPDYAWLGNRSWSSNFDLLKLEGAKVAIASSSRPHTPDAVIVNLLQENDPEIDLAFAKAGHPKSPIVAETLLRRGNKEVLDALGTNPAFAELSGAPVRQLALSEAR